MLTKSSKVFHYLNTTLHASGTMAQIDTEPKVGKKTLYQIIFSW